MSVIRKAANCVMWSDVMEVSNNKQGDDVKFGWDGDGDKGSGGRCC